MRPDNPTLTQALTEWRNGDQDAGNRLFAAAYQELRRLAAGTCSGNGRATPCRPPPW